MTPHKNRISQVVFRSIVIGLALGFAPTVHANPIAPAVVSGSATIATSGNTMTVTNTPGAIINWQQFNIGQSEILKFIQQSAQSSVLNRVISQNPSQILGTLQSNGRVFLINPSGVMFGQGSIINVNGLVASTLNISDSDFLLNRFNFIGSNSASVINKGEITTPLGGSVYLIGNSVSNEGVITSPKGEVILAAGNSVSLLDTGTPHVTVTINAPDNQTVNLGQIVAEGGKVNIYGALLNQQGLISADSASLDAQGNIVLKASQSLTLGQGSVTTANGPQGGTITAQASAGKTTVSGRVEATGTGSGGGISLLGNEVTLTDTARIDASGSTGGGTVLVGGDFQGKNAAVQNAQITYLAQGASIKADAVNSGEGGKVIVWADEATGAFGNISAKGGAFGGNGGFVEVSGKEYLEFDARVDTSAPFGNAGTLLLDPSNITIISGSADPTSGSFSNGTFYGDTSGTSTITWGNIETQLASNNVTIQTGSSSDGGAGDINVSGSPSAASLTISHTAPWDTWDSTYTNTLYSSSNNLSLLAENAVNIYAPFGNAGSGAITIIAGWNGNLTTPDLVTNYTEGKNINFLSSYSSQNGNIIANTGALTLKAADTILFIPGANSPYMPGTNSASIDMNTGALTLVANKISLDASGAASNTRASIQTNGDQSFTIGRSGGELYDGLYLLAANGDNIYGGQAQIRRFGGSGGQSFTFNNGSDLILTGGAGNGLVPAGWWTGNCASGDCSGNNADIDNYGAGNQTFTFASGGALQLEGGSRGNNNGAWIESSTAQVISGNPAITLTGGSSGGIMTAAGYVFENDAGLESNVSQTIDAASITMNGGDADYGGAYLVAPVQTITVTGNVSLTGGDAEVPTAFDHDGDPVLTTGVVIGAGDEDSTSHTLTLTIGGNLTLQGGEVNNYGGSLALIGGFRIPATLTIDTTGSIDLNGAGAGRDQIGSYGGYGGSVHLHSTGGYIDIGQGFVGTGTTGTTHIEAQTTISQAVGGQVQTGGLVMKADGTIDALGNLTANANDVELLSTHGNLNIGTINATGYALLYATEGGVTDANASSLNVTANHLETWAKNGINLDTQVNSIVALNSTAGDIVLREADGASLYNVWNAGGTNQLSTTSGTLTQATNNSGSTNTIGTGGTIYYGSWNVSGGQSSTSPANPRHAFNTEGGMTEISMVSPRSSDRLTDPWLYLLDNSENTLAYNDDGGVGYGAMIRTNLSAGDYTVVAATFSTGVSYPYAMTIGNASAGSTEVVGGGGGGDGSTPPTTPESSSESTTPPIDPCVLNPTLCADTTSSSSLTPVFPRSATDLSVSTAGGDVTFDPNLKVAGGEITFTGTGQSTAESEITKAEGEIKQAEIEIKMAKTPKAKARAEMKKAEAEGKKAEAEAKKAEAEAKQAAVEEKTAKTPVEKAKAEVKKTEAEGKKAEAESRKAEAEAKKAEVEGKQAEVEGKKAEAAAKSANTPEDKARAEKTAEASKAEAEGKKAEVTAKKSEAEAKKSEAEIKKAEIEEKNAKTPVEKAKAEVKKTEAEGRKAEAESRKAEAEAKKAEVEAKQAEGEGKGAKSAEKKVAAEKKSEFKKAEAEAKKAESETKKAEAEEKKTQLEAKSDKSEEKKAEAEKKLENKKAEEAVKKAEAQKKETEYKKADAERKEAGIKSFGKMAVSAMSKDHLKAMLDVRHEYKTDALKTALTILDRNPEAADMPACGAGESGACIQQPTAQITTSLLPAPAIPQFSFLPQIQRKVAVVIGVNKYQDKTIPPLEGAVPDANAVSKMFKENMGYEIRVIHDGTKSEIVQAINKVAGEVDANDSVTIYYAGHGYEMEATKTGYWIPSDGSAKSPANWISSNDINKMLSNIKAKQVLLVSDSCFSGSLAKELKVSAVQGSAEDILGKRSVLVMSSGGDEPVSDEGRDGHSVFAWHFMDKLKGINKYEQGSKLYDGIKTGVNADGFPQTPQYGASVTAGHSTGGDYLFEVRK